MADARLTKKRTGTTAGGVLMVIAYYVWDTPGQVDNARWWLAMFDWPDLLVLAALGLVIWGNWDVIHGWIPRWGSNQSPIIHANQEEVFAAKLDYDSVLADPEVRKVWIAAITASRLGLMKDVELEKVEKLVLAKTTTLFFTHLYEQRDDASGGSYGVEQSIESARRANANGASVVYHDYPIMQCLVVFRHDNDDWLRWEPILPSVKPGHWPSVVVARSRDSATFETLKDAFERHHEAGTSYDDY